MTTEVWTRQQSTVEDWEVVFTGSPAVGSAAGIATVLGVGEFALSSLGVGLATGSATALGVGRATARAVGDADGSATVLGVGFATGVSSAVGLAAGVATVAAVGAESNDGVGLAQGAATVLGVGESTALATGSAAGLVTATGVGASIADAAGAADGVATAAAFGADADAIIVLEAFTGPAFETDASDLVLTLTYPDGIQADDVLLAALVSDWADGWANADGFTQFETNDSNPVHAVRLQLWGKVAAGTETGTTDFTFNSAVVTVMGGAMLRLSGVDVSGGIGVTGGTDGIRDGVAAVNNKSANSPDTSPIGSSITTNTDHAMVLYFEANDGAVNSGSGAPATAVYDADTALGNDIGMALSHKKQAVAGASGTATFTLESAEDWVTITLALKPAIAEGAGAAAGVATAAAVGEDGNTIPAVISDGVQAYLLHTGGPTGAADGAALSFAWAGTFNSDGSAMTLLDIPGTVPAKITRQSDNTIDFVGGTAGAVFSNSTAAVAASVGFCIVLGSCNGTTSHLYVIHAAGLITGVNTAGSATNLDLTADWFLGADGGAAEFLDADTALWWIDDAFIDFSDSDNREQFWDTTGDNLRDPGADGSNPASQPLVCHKSPAATHTSNVGTGGDADTAGTFTDGTSPGTYAADFTPSAAAIALTDTSFNGAAAQEYTFSAQDFGAEAADRFIAVCVYTSASSDFNPTGFVTIGGAAATYALWHKSIGGNGQCGIFAVALPAGTTGVVVVGNPSGAALARCAITVHRITGIGSATASDSDTAEGAGTLGTTVTVANGGVALAAAAAPQATTCTWADITEAEDAQVETCTFTAAEEIFATGGDLTFTPTFAATAAGDAAVAATWDPA